MPGYSLTFFSFPTQKMLWENFRVWIFHWTILIEIQVCWVYCIFEVKEREREALFFLSGVGVWLVFMFTWLPPDDPHSISDPFREATQTFSLSFFPSLVKNFSRFSSRSVPTTTWAFFGSFLNHIKERWALMNNWFCWSTVFSLGRTQVFTDSVFRFEYLSIWTSHNICGRVGHEIGGERKRGRVRKYTHDSTWRGNCTISLSLSPVVILELQIVFQNTLSNQEGRKTRKNLECHFFHFLFIRERKNDCGATSLLFSLVVIFNGHCWWKKTFPSLYII